MESSTAQGGLQIAKYLDFADAFTGSVVPGVHLTFNMFLGDVVFCIDSDIKLVVLRCRSYGCWRPACA